jgi:hypothetical protein
VADPSIQNRNPVTGTSIQEEYQKLGLSFMLGNNDVKAGIVRVKKYLNSHKYNGVKKYMTDAVPLEYHPGLSAVDAPEEFPKLRLSPKCHQLIWEMKRYRWKTYANKKLRYENNPYDEPHKKDDHACDALRYIIMTRPDLVANSGELDQSRVDGIMEGIDKKIIKNSGTLFADPRGLLEPEHPWSPEMSLPAPNDEWQYDEHMGGIL